MINYLPALKQTIFGAVFAYYWWGLWVYLPLLKRDLKRKDIGMFLFGLFQVLILPLANLAATERYIELLIKNPDALCPHEYKDIGTTEVDGMTWNRTQCKKCGHIIITIKEKEE